MTSDRHSPCRKFGGEELVEKHAVLSRPDAADQASEWKVRVERRPSSGEQLGPAGAVEAALRLGAGRIPLQGGQQGRELIDPHHDIEGAPLGVSGVVDPDQLELAGLARDREHRRPGIALGKEGVDHEVIVIPVLEAVMVMLRDDLANVGGAEHSERESADVDHVSDPKARRCAQSSREAPGASWVNEESRCPAPGRSPRA